MYDSESEADPLAPLTEEFAEELPESQTRPRPRLLSSFSNVNDRQTAPMFCGQTREGG
jgi:hypothetical protein